MKKVLLVICTLLLVACSSDDTKQSVKKLEQIKIDETKYSEVLRIKEENIYFKTPNYNKKEYTENYSLTNDDEYIFIAFNYSLESDNLFNTLKPSIESALLNEITVNGIKDIKINKEEDYKYKDINLKKIEGKVKVLVIDMDDEYDIYGYILRYNNVNIFVGSIDITKNADCKNIVDSIIQTISDEE